MELMCVVPKTIHRQFLEAPICATRRRPAAINGVSYCFRNLQLLQYMHLYVYVSLMLSCPRSYSGIRISSSYCSRLGGPYIFIFISQYDPYFEPTIETTGRTTGAGRTVHDTGLNGAVPFCPAHGRLDVYHRAIIVQSISCV